MYKSMCKKIIELALSIVVVGLVLGCEPKSTESTTHSETGSLSTIIDEIYDDCVENKDYDGVKEVMETHKNLTAFCCKAYSEVKYDDVKNRNYENIEYNIGELQIAVAAYNEYNDESAVDVDVNWIRHYNSCTQEQRDAIEAYVYWFGHEGQEGRPGERIQDYEAKVATSLNEMRDEFNLPTDTYFNNLTPAQFEEVQKYMKDPNYQVDTLLWD